MTLAGRRAAVVGVGSTIGAACAHALASAGAEVLVVDPELDEAAAVAARTSGVVGHLQGGFVSEADARAVAAWCDDRWGALDVLVECGSAMELWPPDEDRLEFLVDVLTVNALGPLVYTRALRRLLAAAGGAAVVYLGSIDGLRGNPQVPLYSIGKAGLVALTHVMAASLGGEGIRVNCVAASGLVQTAAALGPPRRATGDIDLATRLTPLGRFPRPEEIASVVAFLASDASSAVSGAVLPVDGGRIAATPGTW